MMLNTKNVDQVAGSVVLIASLLSIGAAVMLATGHGGRVRRETAVVEAKVAEAREAETNLALFQEAFRNATEQVIDIEKHIPRAGRMGAFLEQLDAVIRERHITLMSLQPQAATTERVYTKTPIRLACMGAFSDIHHLLADLEAMSRAMPIGNMVISRPSPTEQCRMDITITYVESSEPLVREQG